MHEPPQAGAVRIEFQCAEPLSQDGVAQLVRRIVSGLPIAPDEVEVNLSGAGWVGYREHDELNLDNLTEAVLWLRRQLDIHDVRWSAVVDL